MVSAVFHGPWGPGPAPEPSAAPAAAKAPLEQAALPVQPPALRTTQPVTALAAIGWRSRWGQAGSAFLSSVTASVAPPLGGLLLLVGIWALVSVTSGSSIPSPLETFKQAVQVFSDPFYRKGPNDQGIGWNILMSLERVAVGFGMAALVGIPAGFLIGRFNTLSRMFNPLISLLRPVSPLAWLPIGLLVFKGANPAAIWTIFICSIWPMIINTAVGVQRVPQDYLNVARVLNLSEWKVMTKILFPAVLPYMLTGVRLAVGTAWLVIVAAEMLTGGVGIGFWVWDEWNNLNVKNIIIAIFVIGLVGLVLEFALIKIATAFTFEDVKA